MWLKCLSVSPTCQNQIELKDWLWHLPSIAFSSMSCLSSALLRILYKSHQSCSSHGSFPIAGASLVVSPVMSFIGMYWLGHLLSIPVNYIELTAPLYHPPPLHEPSGSSVVSHSVHFSFRAPHAYANGIACCLARHPVGNLRSQLFQLLEAPGLSSANWSRSSLLVSTAHVRDCMLQLHVVGQNKRVIMTAFQGHLLIVRANFALFDNQSSACC